MKYSVTTVMCLVLLAGSVSSFHLTVPEEEEAPSWRNSEEESTPNRAPVKFSNVTTNEINSGVEQKGNLNTIIPSPQVITQQLQNTIQGIIRVLNTTLTSLTSNSTAGLGSIIGQVKNLTSSIISKPRLEDVELLAGNITEILRSANVTRSGGESDSADDEANDVEGALRDFESTISHLTSTFTQLDDKSRSSNFERRSGENSEEEEVDSPSVPIKKASKPVVSATLGQHRQSRDGMKMILDQFSRMNSQVDSNIKRSLFEARSKLEDSVIATARQGSQLMNQANDFMNEVRKMFSAFSEPFRQFIDDLRKKGPTAVVTA